MRTSPGSARRLEGAWLRLGVALVVVVSVLMMPGRAEAVRIPTTLAARSPVQAGPVVPGFPIDYLGVMWDVSSDGPSHPEAASASEPFGAVRFLVDGEWGPWTPLIEDGAEGAGSWGSGLVYGADATAYQVRGMPASAVTPRAVAINTTDGPLETVAQRPAVTALSNCVSRNEWGADETWMTWDAEFEPAQALTVHHTATSNGVSDPAAAVRAIYRYHAIDRGWGDIAYQYLIDESGRVYEGRWSGSASAPCSSGGDGIDFGHDTTGTDPTTAGLLVTGGHTYNHNQGNLGIALLGDLTTVGPTAEARAALESALADLATRHGLDPLGTVDYVNPTWQTEVTIDSISGHRDWPSPAGDTSCPGDAFYPMLPDVRLAVAALMGYEVPSVSIGTIGYATSGGRGDKDLTVTLGLSEPIVDAAIDVEVSGPGGVVEATVVTDANGVATLHFRNHPKGCYTTTVLDVRAPGRVWDGVTLANEFCDGTSPTTSSTTSATTTIPGGISITSVDPSLVGVGVTQIVIGGSGFADGATVVLSGGAGPTPDATVVSVGSTDIVADITVKDGGPPRSRTWDLTVQNPDGATSTAAAALTVSP